MIDKFLEMLDVELNEEFDLLSNTTGELVQCGPYHFKKRDDFFHLIDGEGDRIDEYIASIISGFFTIVKLPWKPKGSDLYYYINTNGEILVTRFSRNFLGDLYRFKMGNCFKTTDEAEAHKDEIMRQFEEIREELNA